MIRMMASNGVEVVVEEVVAMQSQIIYHMVEDNYIKNFIPLKHLDFSLPNIEELKDFDNKFVNIDTNALYDCIMVANYLGMKDLIDLVCYKVKLRGNPTRMANEMKKMIRMMASDGKEVGVVEEVVAMQFEIIRHMIEDNFIEDVIHIPNVTASVLSNIFHYCKKHIDFSLPNIEELQDFDNKFVDINTEALYDLIMVNNYPSSTNYLGVKDLIDFICQKVANIIRGKIPEEIRQIFSIENDFTLEEEEKVQKENLWAANELLLMLKFLFSIQS
ncbi:hypothetical protein IEQ34_014890 [Dendrobium chrysotoxum]|uniref:Uncharacterized protein n=1 Tax=Dendrobium chrysotoxum TaxID=161865 RepID=A0AAV7GMU8_DENCH|nr:hypothetical protein IEQ34_014890 [Dendrobium chrysotoxum]